MAVTQALLTYSVDRKGPTTILQLATAMAAVPLLDGDLGSTMASIIGATVFADITEVVTSVRVRRQILFSLSSAFSTAFPSGTDQAGVFRGIFKHVLGSQLKSKVIEGPVVVQEFSPASLAANTYFWVKADRGVSGSPIATWVNQIDSSPPASITQAVGVNRPALVASDAAYGDQPVVSFAGANWLESPVFVAHAQPTTAFMVGQINNAGGRLIAGTGANDQLVINGGANEWAIAAGAGPLVALGKLTTAPSVVIAVYDDAVSSEIYVDDMATSAASGVAGVDSIDQFAIGATVTTGANAMTGKVAEVALFDGHLEQMDRQRLRLYAQDTYGL